MLVASVNIDYNELNYYLETASKEYKLSNNYKRTINILQNMFNITVPLEQIEEYYSPNTSEIEEDLKLQYKHLGLV